MLYVKPSGNRAWVLRYQMNGRRRDLGLGAWPDVTLSMARERAIDARRQVADGVDPLAEKQKIASLTFENAATALIESKRSGWTNERHTAQWPSTLKTYAYAKLGRMDVLDYASAIEARPGEIPARWRGHLDHLLPKPIKVRSVRRHPAMPWQDVPAILTNFEAREGMAARALAFVILTAARSCEVRGIQWGEIGLPSRIWTVPADRMKAAKEQRVPLTDAAVQLLGNARASGDFVFPGGKKLDRPLSDMAQTAVLRLMGRTDSTVHGFRSSFRDWAGETSSFPREVIEAALAHRLKDKAEAAYAHGDLFDKRRQLMRAWTSFLQGN